MVKSDKNLSRKKESLIIFLWVILSSLVLLLLGIGTYYAGFYFFGWHDLDGFNKQGYDRTGFNKTGYNSLGYDSKGYDILGYDENRYDRYGYDNNGLNKFGFNKEGYNIQGYDMNGYDRNGYDRSGYDKNGYDKSGYDKSGYNRLGYDLNGYSRNPTNLEKVKRIAEEYHKTHTYTLPDFFVCSDMAIDVWNLIKTQGIDAKLCAGNIESVYSDTETKLRKMNHAWVLAEVTPFKYVGVETTGGYLVYGSGVSDGSEVENDLYFSNGRCFNSPKEFKTFSDLRTKYVQVCDEARVLADYWNKNIAGTQVTTENSELKGQLTAKQQECTQTATQIASLIG